MIFVFAQMFSTRQVPTHAVRVKGSGQDNKCAVIHLSARVVCRIERLIFCSVSAVRDTRFDHLFQVRFS